MKNITESREKFDTYKLEYAKYLNVDLNEADTRSKLIDLILKDILGWEEEDILREGYSAPGYFDYKISITGFNFLVEAKRKFKEFALPDNHKTASIKSIYHENKDIIDQIRLYATESGVSNAMITNGIQFVMFKILNTDGKPWKDNVCLIFNGIEDIESRFIEFYENASKLNIISNGGFKFDLPVSKIRYETVYSNLVEKDTELIRNSFSAQITPIINSFFGEMFSEEKEDDVEFIRYCFVENDETKKNKNEIERIFGDYAPSLSRVVPAVNNNSIKDQILKEFSQDEVSLKNLAAPKPIVIIGSKGAGKTTFINHLFKIKLKEKEIENQFLIYIDFRIFFETEYHFEQIKIAREILEKIYTKYSDLELHSLKVLKRIYHIQIKRNDESIWQHYNGKDDSKYEEVLSDYFKNAIKDDFEHLILLSKYLIKERRKRLIVIIDNADQFNDDIQEKLFVFAHSLTKASLCGVVISLREGYYYKRQNSPPFDAYDSNIYHITAPNYSEILQRRIDFALEKTKKEFVPIKGVVNASTTIAISSNDIYLFLASLKSSLFADENQYIINFLKHTTYPNIREGLKIFKNFLTSGHTKVAEYILRQKYKQQAKYGPNKGQPIPFHEFLKSIGLQNKHYYNSEISVINNLFAPPKIQLIIF